jgi:tetratricopeptide (TPR) repeat protein
VRSALVLSFVLLAARIAVAEEASNPAKQAEVEFRAGWTTMATPTTAAGQSKLEAYQGALTKTIEHFEAAVEARPKHTDYRTALVYAYLAAGKYQRAYEEVGTAIARNRADPLLYLLRAQAQAALTYVDHDHRGEWFRDALQSFEDAAALDPENALAPLQAASVAYDADQNETAMKKLEQALVRPGITLYRLPIPGDLGADRGESLKLWQAIQLRQWWEIVNRGQNVAQKLVKSGEAYEQAAARAMEGEGEGGESGGLSEDARSYLQTAEERYRTALEVGRQIGNTRPNLVITVNSALNIMQDAYVHLARVGRRLRSPDVQRWEGEAGVVQIGRQYLLRALTAYQESLEAQPPASIDDLLKLEGGQVAGTMLGVALSPAEEPLTIMGGKEPLATSETPPEEKEPRAAPEGATE